MPIQAMLIVMGALGLALVGLGVIRQRRSAVNVDQRLATFADRALTANDLDRNLPFADRVIRPLLHKWSQALGAKSSDKSVSKMKAKLAQAGNPSGFGPAEFIGLRILLAVVLFGGFFVLMSIAGLAGKQGMLISGIAGVFGYLYPGIWLDRKIKARKKEIRKALPDAIDLLTISVESGLGFDPALMRVAEKWDNALSREFARVLSELRIGKAKRDALREMGERCDDDGLSTFVSSIIQADQLGVSISQVLRIQSEAMRVKRRQLAEEQAQKAPLKMLFPMIFLIFPALYVVILGPAVPRMLAAFK